MLKIFRYLAFDKFIELGKIIRKNGGLLKSYKNLYRFDDLRQGELMGIDKYGNKYYEDRTFMYARDRYVHYAPYYGLWYDASQIPPEWHGWIHHRTDFVPCQEPHRPKYRWMLDHTENLSGTQYAYVPYSTTKPKILPWIPPRPCSCL